MTALADKIREILAGELGEEIRRSRGEVTIESADQWGRPCPGAPLERQLRTVTTVRGKVEGVAGFSVLAFEAMTITETRAEALDPGSPDFLVAAAFAAGSAVGRFVGARDILLRYAGGQGGGG